VSPVGGITNRAVFVLKSPGAGRKSSHLQKAGQPARHEHGGDERSWEKASLRESETANCFPVKNRESDGEGRLQTLSGRIRAEGRLLALLCRGTVLGRESKNNENEKEKVIYSTRKQGVCIESGRKKKGQAKGKDVDLRPSSLRTR